MPFMLMEHSEAPAQVIFKRVGMSKDGKIPGFELFGNRVLVGVYERPEKTKSGIYLSDKYRGEEEHMGKAWVVLAMGHSAFKSDDSFDFGPDALEIGDWVMGFVSHGLKCTVNGQLCRIIRDQDITMKIPSPDQVW